MRRLLTEIFKIISSKPKGARRGTGRRGGGAARTQVLGKPVVTPVQRARAAATTVDAPKAIAQGSEKIIVSNLPADVNEAQIKVCAPASVLNKNRLWLTAICRSSSTPPLALSEKSRFTTTPLAAQRVSPLLPSRRRAMAPGLSLSTTTGSSMAVSTASPLTFPTYRLVRNGVFHAL